MTLARLLFVFSLSVLLNTGSIAQVDYSAYNQLLSENVTRAGKVDYASIIENSKEELDAFLKHLASVNPDVLDRDERLAYWINAYNAFTIKLITDHWPVESIKDISDGNPWDEVWITLNGKDYSLNEIENDIIRPRFQDPRIHFAVNCAAVSCPPLLNEPYTGENLDALLDQQTKNFLNDRSHNEFRKNNITISMIFDWYKSDFNNVIKFINKYGETTIDSDAAIRFKEYNWKLNN